jgi:hypothetical protein
MKNLQDTVASVQNAPSSIFTKDDVLNLLNGIEIPKEVSINPLTDFQIRSLIEKITDAVTSNAEDLDSNCIDTDSAEFTLNYDNRIELDSVGFDNGRVADAVLDGIEDVIGEWFEKAFPESEESEDETPEGEVV